MTSVQENKNELEAAVRYCESAISRANATIESMEFRQQAATKAWHEQTGREEALQREVADLKLKNEELKKRNGELRIQLVEWRDRSMGYTKEIAELKSELDENGTMEAELEERISEVADLKQTVTFTEDRLMNATKEVEELKSELDELSKAYKDSTREEITMKQAWREQRELVALRDDQIAMLERRSPSTQVRRPTVQGGRPLLRLQSARRHMD